MRDQPVDTKCADFRALWARSRITVGYRRAPRTPKERKGNMTQKDKDPEQKAKEEKRARLLVLLIMGGLMAVLLATVISCTALVAAKTWKWGWIPAGIATMIALAGFIWVVFVTMDCSTELYETQVSLRKFAGTMTSFTRQLYLYRGQSGDAISRRARYELAGALLQLLEDGTLKIGYLVRRLEPDMLKDVVKKLYAADLKVDPATLPQWKQQLFAHVGLPEPTVEKRPAT